MARPGDVVENPITEDRVTFVETTEDTNGALLRFEWVLPPHFSIPEHIHPHQEECHEVLSGTLRGRVGGPPGVSHAWRNPSDHEELRMMSEMRPALHMEALLEISWALGQALKANRVGVLKQLLRVAVLLDEAKDDFYFTHLPMQAPLAMFRALAPVGRLLEYGANSRVRQP